MSTNDAGMSDEVEVQVHPDADRALLDSAWALAGHDQQPPILRPSASAKKGEWVDYCVALGADRAYLVGESEHFDPAAEVTRTKRVPVGRHDDADPDFHENVSDLIEAAAEVGESADDFAARMRSLYEDAQRRAEVASADPEYREEEVTEHGGMVRSEAFTRDRLIELAERLGG